MSGGEEERSDGRKGASKASAERVISYSSGDMLLSLRSSPTALTLTSLRADMFTPFLEAARVSARLAFSVFAVKVTARMRLIATTSPSPLPSTLGFFASGSEDEGVGRANVTTP